MTSNGRGDRLSWSFTGDDLRPEEEGAGGQRLAPGAGAVNLNYRLPCVAWRSHETGPRDYSLHRREVTAGSGVFREPAVETRCVSA